MRLSDEQREEIEEVYGPIRAWDAATALGFIDDQVQAGLTPVMAGTSFYRHSFGVSQFGSYIESLDERGTISRCQPRNIVSAFDFMAMGIPVAGSESAVKIDTKPAGKAHVVTVVVRPRKLTLLEASVAALKAMDAAGITGVDRDNLEQAISAERRTH